MTLEGRLIVEGVWITLISSVIYHPSWLFYHPHDSTSEVTDNHS